MKTLLHIYRNDEDDSTMTEAHLGPSELSYLSYAMYKSAKDNLLFRAALCAAFESLCIDMPMALEHVQENIMKKKAIIAVTPNPTKS